MDTLLSQILAKKGSQIHTVAMATTVLDAVRLMNSHNIGSLMVVEGEQPVGIFTERDVLTRVIDAGREPGQTPVSEVMTRKPKCVDEDTTLSQAMSVMRQHRFRHLPVIDANGTLMGILSINDLIGWLVEGQENEIAQLTSYIAGSY